MKSLTPELQYHICSLLDSGFSGHQISSQTGFLNTTYHLQPLSQKNFQSSKVLRRSSNNAFQEQHLSYYSPCQLRESWKCSLVTKSLRDVVNHPISTQTIQNGLKKVGMKALVKQEGPTLTPHHKKERLHFARRQQHWNLKDPNNWFWFYLTRQPSSSPPKYTVLVPFSKI